MENLKSMNWQLDLQRKLEKTDNSEDLWLVVENGIVLMLTEHENKKLMELDMNLYQKIFDLLYESTTEGNWSCANSCLRFVWTLLQNNIVEYDILSESNVNILMHVFYTSLIIISREPVVELEFATLLRNITGFFMSWIDQYFPRDPLSKYDKKSSKLEKSPTVPSWLMEIFTSKKYTSSLLYLSAVCEPKRSNCNGVLEYLYIGHSFILASRYSAETYTIIQQIFLKSGGKLEIEDSKMEGCVQRFLTCPDFELQLILGELLWRTINKLNLTDKSTLNEENSMKLIEKFRLLWPEGLTQLRYINVDNFDYSFRGLLTPWNKTCNCNGKNIWSLSGVEISFCSSKVKVTSVVDICAFSIAIHNDIDEDAPQEGTKINKNPDANQDSQKDFDRKLGSFINEKKEQTQRTINGIHSSAEIPYWTIKSVIYDRDFNTIKIKISTDDILEVRQSWTGKFVVDTNKDILNDKDITEFSMKISEEQAHEILGIFRANRIENIQGIKYTETPPKKISIVDSRSTLIQKRNCTSEQNLKLSSTQLNSINFDIENKISVAISKTSIGKEPEANSLNGNLQEKPKKVSFATTKEFICENLSEKHIICNKKVEEFQLSTLSCQAQPTAVSKKRADVIIIGLMNEKIKASQAAEKETAKNKRIRILKPILENSDQYITQNTSQSLNDTIEDNNSLFQSQGKSATLPSNSNKYENKYMSSTNSDTQISGISGKIMNKEDQFVRGSNSELYINNQNSNCQINNSAGANLNTIEVTSHDITKGANEISEEMYEEILEKKGINSNLKRKKRINRKLKSDKNNNVKENVSIDNEVPNEEDSEIKVSTEVAEEILVLNHKYHKPISSDKYISRENLEFKTKNKDEIVVASENQFGNSCCISSECINIESSSSSINNNDAFGNQEKDKTRELDKDLPLLENPTDQEILSGNRKYILINKSNKKGEEGKLKKTKVKKCVNEMNKSEDSVSANSKKLTTKASKPFLSRLKRGRVQRDPEYNKFSGLKVFEDKQDSLETSKEDNTTNLPLSLEISSEISMEVETNLSSKRIKFPNIPNIEIEPLISACEISETCGDLNKEEESLTPKKSYKTPQNNRTNRSETQSTTTGTRNRINSQGTKNIKGNRKRRNTESISTKQTILSSLSIDNNDSLQVTEIPDFSLSEKIAKEQSSISLYVTEKVEDKSLEMLKCDHLEIVEKKKQKYSQDKRCKKLFDKWRNEVSNNFNVFDDNHLKILDLTPHPISPKNKKRIGSKRSQSRTFNISEKKIFNDELEDTTDKFKFIYDKEISESREEILITPDLEINDYLSNFTYFNNIEDEIIASEIYEAMSSYTSIELSDLDTDLDSKDLINYTSIIKNLIKNNEGDNEYEHSMATISDRANLLPEFMRIPEIQTSKQKVDELADQLIQCCELIRIECKENIESHFQNMMNIVGNLWCKKLEEFQSRKQLIIKDSKNDLASIEFEIERLYEDFESSINEIYRQIEEESTSKALNLHSAKQFEVLMNNSDIRSSEDDLEQSEQYEYLLINLKNKLKGEIEIIQEKIQKFIRIKENEKKKMRDKSNRIDLHKLLRSIIKREVSNDVITEIKS
ncbi:uncharacterized protein CMU_019270 [Cryptosporidium muris RN66]|uniref:Uncharacterized protein n=1 Tax=Cryptosporidium muris (strain RN66) TaxID=441375 RepID=B6ACB4_CRYMR|nr:uncharacterized protein CMU_019270 [Cryptosporidium muris RN66]EEA06170.1 hypothetical protein, conserved [Cryptosporidium muris RN66]|eukprot:XP_002140519.1 hypothetical protein [Cryptosporidium muris RN66]